MRLRARAPVRHLTAHALPPSEEAARGRDRRFRAPGTVGLLLRPPRCPEGALHMAELTDTTDSIRETVRRRYADAARAASEGTATGCSADGSCCAPSVALEHEPGPQ